MLLFVAVPLVLAASIPIPPRQLDVCFQGPFRGITETNAIGEVIGETDRSDWGCATSGSGAGIRSSVRAGRSMLPEGVRSTQPVLEPVAARSLEGGPVEPPTDVCFTPAFPNPANVEVELRFAVPRAADAELAIYGQQLGGGPFRIALVRTLLESTLNPGFYTFRWDLRDAQGTRVEPGVYRAVLRIEGQTLCGDIEVR